MRQRRRIVDGDRGRQRGPGGAEAVDPIAIAEGDLARLEAAQPASHAGSKEPIGDADAAAVGESAQWLREQDVCLVTLWNNSPLVVAPPNFVELTITETDPGVRGDTASGTTKPATLSTGAVIQVPLFINEGEVVRIDTRTGEYMERVR